MSKPFRNTVVRCFKVIRTYNHYERACRRKRFISKYRKEVTHVMSHGFDFHSPLRSCQILIVDKMRKEIPYSYATATRDILWRLSKDWGCE